MRWSFILPLALASLAASAQPDESRCLPPSEVRLGPLAIAASVATLVALGLPDETEASIEEDDGGRTIVATFWYGDLWVDAVRDRVDAVGTESEAFTGPRGVAVGMARAEAERRLGGPFFNGETPDEGWWPGCGSEGLVATFGDDGRIEALSVVALRP